MYLIIALVLIVAWVSGFFLVHISSLFIHLLLIFAVVSIIFHFLRGSRTA